MIVGITGLGLIGGSMAKAYKKAGHTVLGYDKDSAVTEFALLGDIIDATLKEEDYGKCDLLLICTYPEAAIDFLSVNATLFGDHPVVMDCCGTKRAVTKEGFRLANENDFTFVGGHPMAGTQYSGLKYAREDLFSGAPMVIVPDRTNDIVFLDRIKKLLAPVGFGSIHVSDAETHDRVIAFSSQLAHLVSNAYVKSPTAKLHNGISAGSYKDMTRVAWLNPDMWTELFIENKDHLIEETEQLIDHLGAYLDALKKDDRDGLRSLLAEGRRIKEEVDGSDGNHNR